MTWQAEDRHRVDMGRVLMAQQPLYRDFWRRQATIGEGVKSSRNVGPSANWFQMSAGLCCWDKYDPGRKSIALVLTEPNDLWQGEYLVDPAHGAFTLEGMMFQRKYLRRDKHPLAEEIDKTILQWWAHQLLCADQLDTPAKTVCAFAHQRTVYPVGGTTEATYYWRRGLGIPHDKTGMAKMADRIAKGQAPFTNHLFADAFLADLKNDVARLIGTYRVGGYGALSRLILRGGRGEWHWIRFANGGYLSCGIVDIGVDEPRYVVMRPSGGAAIRQFPEGQVTRTNRDGGCKLDTFKGTVSAFDSVYGKFSATFDPKSITLWVTATPNGVIREVDSQGGGATAGVPGSSPTGDSPAIPPPPVDSAPPPRLSWFDKLLSWF